MVDPLKMDDPYRALAYMI